MESRRSVIHGGGGACGRLTSWSSGVVGAPCLGVGARMGLHAYVLQFYGLHGSQDDTDPFQPDSAVLHLVERENVFI